MIEIMEKAATEIKASKSQGKRIVLTTYGSLGDLYPYMAIARELQARGHQAAIATSSNYRHYIEAEGIEFHPLRPESLPKIQQDWEFFKMLSDDCHKGTEYIICYLLMPHLRAIYSDLMDACQGADLLLTHPLTLVGAIIAEKIAIPWVSSVLSPSSFMSAYDVSPIADSVPFSSYQQALTIVARDAALRRFRWYARLWSVPIQQLRAEEGFLPSGDPIFEGQHSPKLVLALFSRVLASPQPDWPPQTLITGFPFNELPESVSLARDISLESEGLSPELENFLNSGSPPIVFTLGSTAVSTPGNFYIEGAAAAKQLGYRAVLLMGDAARQIPPNLLSEGVIAVDYAPHSLVFPRAAAIVHHGGMGTTGQALRSGRPMLIVPYNYDQPENAEQAVRLGVARTVECDRFLAATVATELQQLLFDPSYGSRASQLQQIVLSEDGAKTACDAIEIFLRDDNSIKK